MRSRDALSVRWVGALALLCAAGCQDYLTGQTGEPEGAIRITRLTLLDDHLSRDASVFTDTSAPPDCEQAQLKATDACTSDPFGDRFSLKKSPPTPDSGADLRVVLNKLPLLLGAMDILKIEKKPDQPVTKIEISDPKVLQLACDGCTGIPPVVVNARVGGSGLSVDPTQSFFPYGPSLQLSVTADDAHPLAALEPGTPYRVIVDPRVAGRDGAPVVLDDRARSLLLFTTEPFQVLRVGIGDAEHDAWVYADDSTGDGSVGKPYQVTGLALDGVIALNVNAPLDEGRLGPQTATAQLGGAEVPIMLGTNLLMSNMEGKPACAPGRRRVLYIFPTTPDRTWGSMAGELTLTLKGSDIYDVSQAAGHPVGQGTHALGREIVIKAQLLSEKGGEKYAGIKSGGVSANADCPK